jgi:hypothetical protein
MATKITSPRATVLSGWPDGVDNIADLKDLQRRKAPALREAVNVDIGTTGKPRRRKGYSLIQAGHAHSIYAPRGWPLALLVHDGELKVLRNEGGSESLTTLGAIDKFKPVAYCTQNDWIHGTNGVVTFRVNRDGVIAAWGVPMPAGFPVATPIAQGSMPPGRYQLAMTHLDALGEESGANPPILVELATDGGIELTDIPQPAGGVESIRFYLSPQNGTELYHAATIPIGVSSYAIYTAKDLWRDLETMHCDRVPPARFLCAYKGRIYFFIGNTLYYTLPLRYGVFKVHQTYFRFPHRGVGVAATDDALIVGTTHRAYRLQGDDPAGMTMLPIDDHGVVEGAMLEVPGGRLAGDVKLNTQNVVWLSTGGVLMRAAPGGAVIPITQGRLAIDRFAAGSMLYREQDEIAQIVSVLRGPQSTSGFAARDYADAVVVKNGITL